MSVVNSSAGTVEALGLGEPWLNVEALGEGTRLLEGSGDPVPKVTAATVLFRLAVVLAGGFMKRAASEHPRGRETSPTPR